MAIDFNQGLTQLQVCRLKLTSAIATAAPISFFVWFRAGAVPGGQGATLCVITKEPPGGTAANTYFALELAPGPAKKVRAATQFITTQTVADSSDSWVLDTWHSAGAVFASTASIIAYLDGVPGTENTTSYSTPTPLEGTIVAAANTSTVDTMQKGYEGCMAYLAVWESARTEADFIAMHNGTSPDTIDPGSLVTFLPMIAEGSAGDNSAGSNFTAVEPAGSNIADCSSSPIVTGVNIGSYTKVIGF